MNKEKVTIESKCLPICSMVTITKEIITIDGLQPFDIIAYPLRDMQKEQRHEELGRANYASDLILCTS